MTDWLAQLEHLAHIGARAQHERAYTHGPSDGHLPHNGMGNSRFPECSHADCVFAREQLRALLAELRAVPREPDLDEQRWKMVWAAIHETRLSPIEQVIAIGSIVLSRQPHNEADIARTAELAAKYGWEKNGR